MEHDNGLQYDTGNIKVCNTGAMKSLVWLSLSNAWSKLSSAQKYQLMRQGFEKASNQGVDLKKYRLWKMNSMTKPWIDESWAE